MDIATVSATVLLPDRPSIVIGTAAATTESPNVAIASTVDVHLVRCNTVVTENHTYFSFTPPVTTLLSFSGLPYSRTSS